jgi:osmotically inducible lipoprotein OsmB
LCNLLSCHFVAWRDGNKQEETMRKLYIAAVLAALTAIPATANAYVRERTLTGAAIGAGAGAVVAGPVGAVVGGVGGAVIGGPRITHRHHCWRDRHGYRHCRY